jgi:hypothetical protein
VKFVATKKGKTTIFPLLLLLLLLDLGSGIRDPGSGSDIQDLESEMDKNWALGSGINKPEPQHCQQGMVESK